MAEKYKKPEKFVTPSGVFIWPRLDEPDTKFKAEGEYSLKLRMSQEYAERIIGRLEPLYQEALKQGHKEFAELPVATRKKLGKPTENPLFTPDYDEEENETGDVIFKFGMTASGVNKKTGKPWSRKPDVFDAKKNRIDGKNVWGGTVGKVSFTTNPYFIPGSGACGLSLRLEAVQVIDLVSSGGRTADAHGFGEEDGYDADAAAARDTDDDADEDSGGGDGDF